MHRFVEFRTIGRAPGCDLVLDRPGIAETHARAALRADGTLWLLDQGGGLQLNRGGCWIAAKRLWLCAEDRVRLGEAELRAQDICALFGISLQQASLRPAPATRVARLKAPRPLAVPAGELHKLRRNPDTGQLEHPSKVSR